jgi:hypothetical protein
MGASCSGVVGEGAMKKGGRSKGGKKCRGERRYGRGEGLWEDFSA